MHLKGSAEKVAFPTRLCASTAVKITPPPTTASQPKEGGMPGNVNVVFSKTFATKGNIFTFRENNAFKSYLLIKKS